MYVWGVNLIPNSDLLNVKNVKKLGDKEKNGHKKYI